MWCLRSNAVRRSMSLQRPLWWNTSSPYWNDSERSLIGKHDHFIQNSFLSSLNGYMHSFATCSTSPAKAHNVPYCSRFHYLPFTSGPLLPKPWNIYPSHLNIIQRSFSRRDLTPAERYLKRRRVARNRKMRKLKAMGIKPRKKITHSMRDYKKRRKVYILELLRREMAKEERAKETGPAPQLPILAPYDKYEMVPRPEKIGRRQRLTLGQKVHNLIFGLQQDRLAQKNPLHYHCRTCPVCRRKFTEGRQKMLLHLFHFLPCWQKLPVDILNALILQKEYNDRYEKEHSPIIFKRNKRLG